MQCKLDDHIAKLNRATRVNRDYEMKNKILNADNTQLKEEILKYTEKNTILELYIVKLQSKIDALELKIKNAELEMGDFKINEIRLKEKIETNELKISLQIVEIQDLNIDLERLVAENGLQASNIQSLKERLEVKTRSNDEFET